MDSYEGLTDALGFRPPFDWITSIAITFVSIFLSTYIVTAAKSAFSRRRTKSSKAPPVIPYFIPLIGNTISFARNPAKFVTYVT